MTLVQQRPVRDVLLSASTGSLALGKDINQAVENIHKAAVMLQSRQLLGPQCLVFVLTRGAHKVLWMRLFEEQCLEV